MDIINEFHTRVCGGHHDWRSTAYKILRDGCSWPNIFVNTNALVRELSEYQIFARKHKILPLPLRPIKVEELFQSWGLDFIGEINPKSSGQHKWILLATYYFTKWV